MRLKTRKVQAATSLGVAAGLKEAPAVTMFGLSKMPSSHRKRLYLEARNTLEMDAVEVQQTNLDSPHLRQLR